MASREPIHPAAAGTALAAQHQRVSVCREAVKRASRELHRQERLLRLMVKKERNGNG
jgi:hypothetical protein